MQINEGGNVFKDEQGQPLTQRINQNDVQPTVQWLEQITGLDFTTEKNSEDGLPARWLGSTGRKPTSGDLDLQVDTNEITKEQLVGKLQAWATKNQVQPEKYIRKSGISVHFLTAIGGNPRNGFVQTDFMFTHKPRWNQFVLQSDPASSFKGASRNILINSMAKSLGYKLNQNDGIADRATNEIITDDPDQVAPLLLNSRATVKDLYSVERIMAALKNDPQRDQKLADFRDHMQRAGTPLDENVEIYTEYNEVSAMARLRDRIVNQGMQALVEQTLMEDRNPRIPYIEDLVFQKGVTGAREALAIIADTARNTSKYATQKWDGSPAVIFGRDAQGQFRLTDKGSMGPEGPARSVQGITDVMAQRDQRAAEQGKRTDRVEKLVPMYRELWPYLEQATPRDFRGYLKGDMLYSSADPVRQEGDLLVFQPNKLDGIQYRIPKDSQLGQAISKSRIGIAIHTRMDDPQGQETPVGDPTAILKPVPGLMITGAEVSSLQNIQPDSEIVAQVQSRLQGSPAQSLADLLKPDQLRQRQITDLPALMERFINSLKGTDYSQAQPKDFGQWLQTQVSPRKLKNIIEYLRESQSRLLGMQTAFDIWNLLHRLKQDLQRQLDQQVPGQEGWVLATPAGRAKIVSRMAGGFGARKAQSNQPATTQN
jgi:hypothetical protein